MDKRVTREQLNILALVNPKDYEDSFVAYKDRRTWVWARFTQVDTVAGLGYGYYVFALYGPDQNHTPRVVTSATFFEDDDRNYCGTNAAKAAEEHFENLRRVQEVRRMHATAE